MRSNRRPLLCPVITGLSLSLTAFLITSPVLAQPIDSPDGWIKSESNGATIFRPADLPSGKLYFIVVFPEEPLNGKTLTQWFSYKIDNALSKVGTVIQRGKVEQKVPKALTCVSSFKPPVSEELSGNFTARSPRAGYGQLLMLTSVTETAIVEKYKSATERIVKDFLISSNNNQASAKSESAKTEPTKPTTPTPSPTPTATPAPEKAPAKEENTKGIH